MPVQRFAAIVLIPADADKAMLDFLRADALSEWHRRLRAVGGSPLGWPTSTLITEGPWQAWKVEGDAVPPDTNGRADG